MEILEFLVLIFMSLVSYSGGAVSKAGKFIDFKPNIFDLILVMIIWAGAIYSRITFDLNKCLLIIIWVFLSIIAGRLTLFFRALPDKNIPGDKKLPKASTNIFNKLWQNWKDFSKKIGIFESRIMLSLFFFIFISPFALAVKLFSKPLKIKMQDDESYWLLRKEIKNDLEQYKRQF